MSGSLRADASDVNALPVIVLGSRIGLARDLELAAGRRTGVRALGPFPSIDDVVQAWTRRVADVVVVDADVHAATGTVGELVARIPGVKVLVAGDGCVATIAADALAAGACGVLPLPATPSVVAGSCRRAADGELVLPDSLLAQLMEQLRGIRTDPFLRLTARERQVLAMVAEGMATSDVAVALGIGVPTVHSHIRGMLEKLGVRTTMEAVRIAWREGMVELPVGA